MATIDATAGFFFEVDSGNFKSSVTVMISPSAEKLFNRKTKIRVNMSINDVSLRENDFGRRLRI